jgi:hypothetical protein
MIKIIFPRKEKRTASYNLRAPLCALAVSLFLSAAPLPAQDKLPKPADFAGEITLDGEGGRLLKIELPEAVFRGLRRSDLGDIRVFDADGAAVPFLTRPVPGALETPPPREIPFFPWKEEAGRTLPETADIELDAAGTVLRVKSRNAAQLERQAYLLDLSGLEYPPEIGRAHV